MLRAAFGKLAYTPPPGTRLGRLGVNIFIAQGVHSSLEARVALFDDGQQRLALVALDQGFVSAAVTARLRAAVQTGAAVPPAQCLVSVTHTHNAPALMPWRDDDPGYAQADTLAEQLVELSRQLAAQLAPVELRLSETTAPGWAENRRSIYRQADGREWVATHGDRAAPGFVRPEGPDETALRALWAVRPDGTVAGGLVNFWCHPTTLYDEPVWSADFPGVVRARLEREVGGTFVYLTGPCGDLSPARNELAFCEPMGTALAEKLLAGRATARPLAAESVGAANERLTLAQRMVTPAQVRVAREYLAGTRPSGSAPLVEVLYAWPFHFASHTGNIDDWMAQEILGMWEWQKRAAEPVLHETVEVQALRVGDLVLATIPGELFSALGHAILADASSGARWVVELANGYHGYLPTPAAFAHGGYECCLGYQSRLEPKAGEKLVAVARRLATKLRL
ncbi:MAG: hypothetical protein PCFJNLEI_01658 [Verrucomicrobiae bacterium]|nr:hypothetical protein [Verrucomicrobiae bacterium]